MSKHKCSSFNINLIDGKTFCTRFLIMNCKCNGDIYKCSKIKKEQENGNIKKEQKSK